MTSYHDVLVNVIANVIAWPIIFVLGRGAIRTWGLIKDSDSGLAEELRTNVAYRSVVAASAVSEIVMGCFTVLAAMAIEVIVLLSQSIQLTTSEFKYTQSMQAVLAKALLADKSGKPLVLPVAEAMPPHDYSFGMYLSFLMMASGVVSIFVGRRFLAHLKNVTRK